jgi:hypothetical protein
VVLWCHTVLLGKYFPLFRRTGLLPSLGSSSPSVLHWHLYIYSSLHFHFLWSGAIQLS